jgi:hypothetical protein
VEGGRLGEPEQVRDLGDDRVRVGEPRHGEVLANAARLAGIPGVLVQGTLDLGNLIGTPWALAAAWPGVELRMVDAAHERSSAGMIDGLVEATDRFAGLAIPRPAIAPSPTAGSRLPVDEGQATDPAR